MTPKTDALLDEYYKTVTPGERRCAETGDIFFLTQEMIDVYKKCGVPVPTTAPNVRLRRLRSHMGGIELFQRQTIHGTSTISMYDPGSPARLLDPIEWHDDGTALETYAQVIDPKVPFFDQWNNFSLAVPRPSVFSDPNSEQSAWSLYEIGFKDCYATYGGVDCTELLYGDMCISASHSVDAAFLVESEWSYECVRGYKNSHTFFSDNCESCINVFFSFGCNNCSDCFACVNLENKQYCILNVQYSKEEYFEKIAQFDLSDSDTVQRLLQESRQFWKQGFHHVENNVTSERVEGDDIIDSVDTYGVSTFQTARVYNVFDAAFVNDSCDISTCSKLETSVNAVACTAGYENKMSISCHGCIDVEYSELCISCEHCFGCIGLKRKKFCIFNIQYSEEEYWKKLDEIKSEMLKRGEYGEFFPYASSLVAYNVSHADVFFPLSQNEVSRLHGRWFEFPVVAPNEMRLPPKKLAGADVSLLQNMFTCAESGRAFRIVEPELVFHKKFNLALPVLHPTVRRKKRYVRGYGLQLRKEQCARCKKEIISRIDPEMNTKNLCGQCYAHLLSEEQVILQ
jgi:hypothetical protein